MFKSKCSSCGRTYQTEADYSSYICEDCKRKKAEYENGRESRDRAILEEARKKMEAAIAGGNQTSIDIATTCYYQIRSYIEKEYGNG